MKIDFSTEPKEELTVALFSAAERGRLPVEVPKAEFCGASNSLLHLHAERMLCIGLGDPAKIDAQRVRSAAGVAAMFLKKTGRTAMQLDLRGREDYAGAAVEGVVLADYRFAEYRKSEAAELKSLRCIVEKSALAAAKRECERGRIVAEATNEARAIGNLPGNVLWPESLADRAEKLAKKHGLRVTILDEKALKKGKFGGLLAVGGGSMHPPRLIVLEHRGGKAGDAPIALVGKAITFDSGGISIKPGDKMEEMIFDKCGGMAVLGAMAGIADLKLKRNVVGIVASAENLPSATAYRPGDIVTAYDRKHIEIINTDAEGRVVLADALGYARQDCKAAEIIDLATLTGACGVALGECVAGLWSTSDALERRLLESSGRTGERLWPMPLFPEYDEQIKSDVALVKNTGGRLAGACTAAAFLKAFVGDTPWAHLDIAYMASLSKDRPDLARGATGFGTRLLIDLVEQR